MAVSKLQQIAPRTTTSPQSFNTLAATRPGSPPLRGDPVLLAEEGGCGTRPRQENKARAQTVLADAPESNSYIAARTIHEERQ